MGEIEAVGARAHLPVRARRQSDAPHQLEPPPNENEVEPKPWRAIVVVDTLGGRDGIEGGLAEDPGLIDGTLAPDRERVRSMLSRYPDG